MRVLFDGGIHAQAPGGGAIRYINQLVNGLVAHGVEADLLVRKGARLRCMIGSPDCRVVHGVDAAAGYDIFRASCYTDLRSVPGAGTVVTIHDLIDEMLPRSLTACGSWAMEMTLRGQGVRGAGADHLVAISDATRQDLVRVFCVSQERVTVIHHGVPRPFSPVEPTERESRLKGEPGLSKPYILHVGGRDGYKYFGLQKGHGRFGVLAAKTELVLWTTHS